MNKHIFKTRELPILAAIAMLLRLAALIDTPTGQTTGPVYRLNTPDYALAGFDNISLYVLDYGYLITQTGFYEKSPSFICVSADSLESEYYSLCSIDFLPKNEQAEIIVTSSGGPVNFHTAGLYIACGPDCP